MVKQLHIVSNNATMINSTSTCKSQFLHVLPSDNIVYTNTNIIILLFTVIRTPT